MNGGTQSGGIYPAVEARRSNTPVFYVYILKCSDGSFYIGLTEDLDRRLNEHQSGVAEQSYTRPRRPVVLVWSAAFETRDAAFRAERQIKGWSRAKKEALIRGRWGDVHEVVKKERRDREGPW